MMSEEDYFRKADKIEGEEQEKKGDEE